MTQKRKYISILASTIIITITSFVLYFCVFNKSDNFAISYQRKSLRPDIEFLSGGMAGSEVPDPHYRWSYSLKSPHEGYPYFGNPYSPPTCPPTLVPGFYQNNPEIDRFITVGDHFVNPYLTPYLIIQEYKIFGFLGNKFIL